MIYWSYGVESLPLLAVFGLAGYIHVLDATFHRIEDRLGEVEGNVRAVRVKVGIELTRVKDDLDRVREPLLKVNDDLGGIWKELSMNGCLSEV